MAETLGSLCDKLTIVKLKQFHVDNDKKLMSLSKQESSLIKEIDQYLVAFINGRIPVEKLTFESNKIYNEEKNIISDITGNIGTIISELSRINCELWHVQDKLYNFESVPVQDKDEVVKRVAILNLERNQCVDKINDILRRYA
jgi:hypothetical protein